MKRLFFVTFVLVISIFAISCGKTAVKKVSEDSRITTEAFSVINSLKEAYLRNDVMKIEENTTSDGIKSVTGVMKHFESAELTFTPVLVEIDEGNVSVNISWKGVWKSGTKTTEERGMAVFILKGTPLKVDAVLRANPFKYPE